jgi:hypothetical protein
MLAETEQKIGLGGFGHRLQIAILALQPHQDVAVDPETGPANGTTPVTAAPGHFRHQNSCANNHTKHDPSSICSASARFCLAGAFNGRQRSILVQSLSKISDRWDGGHPEVWRLHAVTPMR